MYFRMENCKKFSLRNMVVNDTRITRMYVVICTVGLCVLPPSWIYTYADNISQGKPADQLGTWCPFGSARAVDGKTDQNFDGYSCAYPDGFDDNLDESKHGSSTWWRVDLADGDTDGRFVIKNVKIYFNNCCPDRIIGIVILVGNTSDISTQKECARITTGDYVQTVPCRPSTPVRFLTVRHPTNARLGLCEVIVNGYASSENIAEGKPTAQHGKWCPYGPEKALDGNTDQILEDLSCAHPDGVDGWLEQRLRGPSTWWRVDLGDGDADRRFVIENVTLYFRIGFPEFLDRVVGVLLLIGNTSDITSYKQCAEISAPRAIQTLPCDSTEHVRYLAVKHPTNAHLGLCEVIVSGYEYGGKNQPGPISNTPSSQPIPVPSSPTSQPGPVPNATSQPGPVSNTLSIIGGAVGGVLFVLVIAVIVGCVCWRRRGAAHAGPSAPPKQGVDTATAHELPELPEFPEQPEGEYEEVIEGPPVLPKYGVDNPATTAHDLPDVIDDNYVDIERRQTSQAYEHLNARPATQTSESYQQLDTYAIFNQWMVDNRIDNETQYKLSKHGVTTVQDVYSLSQSDMVEIGLNVGERNRIKNAIAKK